MIKMPVCQKCLKEIDQNKPQVKCPSCGMWHHRYASCMDARDNSKYYSYVFIDVGQKHIIFVITHTEL